MPENPYRGPTEVKHTFHITRDIKNTKVALQMLPASLCGAFLVSIWPQIGH